MRLDRKLAVRVGVVLTTLMILSLQSWTQWAYSAHASSYQGSVTVHFIDVGQGDAIFIDTTDKDVLIDGGRRSVGKTVVSYLLNLNVTRIDILVATHADSDHIGGLITVISEFDALNYSIPLVIENDQPKTTKTYLEYDELASKRQRVTAERGQKYQLNSMTYITILNPTKPLEFSDHNENSVVIRMVVNQVSFLFTGDAESEAEESMIKSNLTLSSNVLKVGHHGSRTSSSPKFLDAVKPQIAVISAGRENRYGHPHQEVIDRLVERGITPYGTHVSGTIIITTDGQSISLQGNPTVIPEFPIPTVLLGVIVALSLVLLKPLKRTLK